MDQPTGYAVLAGGQPVRKEVEVVGAWGGSAAWVLVWVVVIIIIIAILAALFMGGGSFLDSSSSSDDDNRHRKGKGNDWNFNWLGGLVVFIVVILFLCWLLSSAGGYGHRC